MTTENLQILHRKRSNVIKKQWEKKMYIQHNCLGFQMIYIRLSIKKFKNTFSIKPHIINK